MKRYRYKELHASGDNKKPKNTHLWWKISDSLWYMVDSANQKVLLKSVDKGEIWTIVTTRTLNIVRGCYDDSSKLYLADCSFNKTRSYIWSLETSNDSIIEEENVIGDIYDVFKTSNGDINYAYFDIFYNETTGDFYPDGSSTVGTSWLTSGCAVGSEHLCVDELKGAVPDGNYLYNDSWNLRHNYLTLDNVPLVGDNFILSVKIYIYCKKDAGTVGNWIITYENGGVLDYDTLNLKPIVTTSYAWYSKLYASPVGDLLDGNNLKLSTDGQGDLNQQLYFESVYLEVKYTTSINTQTNLIFRNLTTSTSYTKDMGDATGRTYDMSYKVEAGNDIYFLWKWSDENVEIWKWEKNTANFTEMEDCGSNTDLADALNQRGVAYNGANHISFVLKDTSDAKKYFYTYGITTDILTKGGESNVAIMLDRNTGSGYREKAFHITDYEIYELTNNKSNLLLIDTPALDSAVAGITDNYLITSDATPVVWEYIDREKELIDDCEMDYKRGNPTSCNFISYEEISNNEGVLFYDDNDDITFEGSIIEREYDEVDKWIYKCMGFDVELTENKLQVSATAENAKTLVQRVLDQCKYLTYTSTSITDPAINITLEPKSSNVRTILKTIADLCEYVFYVTPSGIVYFNDGTVSSGKTVTQNSGIFGKPKVKDIPVQINLVKISGTYVAGERLWKTAKDEESQLKYGINRYIDHFPLIDDATELQNLANKILARKGMADNPKYIYTDLYGLNYVQCGNTLSYTFSPLNLSVATYYILNQKYNAKKNEGKFVLSSGIVSNWRGYGYAYGKTSEADEEQIDSLATKAIIIDRTGDIDSLAEKVTPVNADIILIEDSAASYAKKKVQITNLPSGVSEAVLFAYLAIGIANKRWENCILEGGNLQGSFKIPWCVSNVGAADYTITYTIPLPYIMNGKNLVITQIKVGVYDADVNNYVDHVYVYCTTGINLTTPYDDGTNRTAQGNYTYNPADITLGGNYEKVWVQLKIFATTVNMGDFSMVKIEYYYA